MGLLVHLYQSFSAFQDYGTEGDKVDKSVNAHNCRKSSILSKLFCIHKFISLLGFEIEGLSATIADLFLQYARAYVELPSCVTDLQMYIPYLSQAQLQTIHEALRAYVEETKKEVPVRYVKARITVNKFAFVFRQAPHASIQELQDDLKQLTMDYFEFVKADEKPEKGERKVADEQIVLIGDIIENFVSTSSEPREVLLYLQLYKICLLEYAYDQSCYNFDIQLSLAKCFDELGLSTSFNESYNTMDIKGVQLESMGYLYSKYALKWNNFSNFQIWHPKYLKYIKNNNRDLSDCKLGALNDFNFDQLENFIDYEDYLHHSYYGAFVLEYLDKTRALLVGILNQQQMATNQDYFGNGRTVAEAEERLNELRKGYTVRTQDVKVVVPKFRPLCSSREAILNQASAHKYLDDFAYDKNEPFAHTILKGDVYLSSFKYERKTNFKPGLLSTLSAFENIDNFTEFYRVFVVNNTAVVNAVINKATMTDAILAEQRKQLAHSSVQASDPAYLVDIFEMALEMQDLSFGFLAIRKEDRAGPEVASELVAKNQEQVAKLQAKMKETLAKWTSQHGDIEMASILLQIAGCYLPFVIEGLSDSLKLATPNMKKKKDPAFDELKTQVIKPLKELNTQLKDFFSGLSAWFNDQAQLPLIGPEPSKFFTQITDNEKLLHSMESKRLEQVNKEYKASLDKLKDMAEKVSKRFQALGQQAKGFNP